MERMKKMMENMSEEERVRMMERCFELMKGKKIGKDKGRDEKEKEETDSFSGMRKMAECCPEMMGTFLTKMKDCFERMGEKEKKDTREKTE